VKFYFCQTTNKVNILLIYVRGYTVQSEGSSFGGDYGPGVFVYGNLKRQTHSEATIWNLKQIVCIGESSVKFQPIFRKKIRKDNKYKYLSIKFLRLHGLLNR